MRHFLASLAYRTHKALAGAPRNFATLSVGNGVRTPLEILSHEDVERMPVEGTIKGRPVTLEELLHGPLSDVMTHAGQLALLRRLAGSPLPPERFIEATIRVGQFHKPQSGGR